MALKEILSGNVNLEEFKTKLFNDLQMMQGIKVKGIDTIGNAILISLKTGKTKITSTGSGVEIESKSRLFPFWTWDLILDRVRTKKVHQRIIQIINENAKK